MGWCGATQIMDTAIDAADAVVVGVVETMRDPAGPKAFTSVVDEVLRPLVRTLAEKLRDADWDCIDESRHFDRFPQEMLGYDNREFGQWLVDKVGEAGPTETKYVRWLSAWQAKEVQHGG